MFRTLTRKFSKLSKGKDIFFPKYGNSFYEYSDKEIKNKTDNIIQDHTKKLYNTHDKHIEVIETINVKSEFKIIKNK
jgi:hypothetical protein